MLMHLGSLADEVTLLCGNVGAWGWFRPWRGAVGVNRALVVISGGMTVKIGPCHP